MLREIFDSAGFAVVTEFYQYDPETKVGKYMQTTNQGNSRCAKEDLVGVMPDVDIDEAQCEIGSERYLLSNCEETGSLSPPTPPAYGRPCPACNDAVDIVFAVDTSLSVCGAVQDLSRTVQDLISSYNLGPNAVHVGIVRFAWRSWTTSRLQIGTALNRVTYPSNWPFGCGTLANGCKARRNNCLGTCISCGMRQAVDLLDKEGRPGVPKAIIVLTDGYHNMKWVGNSEEDGAHSIFQTPLCPARNRIKAKKKRSILCPVPSSDVG
jgi:hypothetical protein